MVHTLRLFLCFTPSEQWSSHFICGHWEPAKKHSTGWSEALIPLPVGWSLALLIQHLACGWGAALPSPRSSCACRFGSHSVGNKAKVYQHCFNFGNVNRFHPRLPHSCCCAAAVSRSASWASTRTQAEQEDRAYSNPLSFLGCFLAPGG